MTPALQELKRLAEAATPGPWCASGMAVGTVGEATCCGNATDSGECCGNPHWDLAQVAEAGENDAAYIAAADPSTLLSLIAEIESKDAEIERLREALKPFADCAAFYDDAEYNEDHLTSNVSVGELFRARAALGKTKRYPTTDF